MTSVLNKLFMGILSLIFSIPSGSTHAASTEPYRFLPKHVMVCGPKKVDAVISLGHFEQKEYVEILSDGTGRYVSYLHRYQFTTFDKQTYYHTPSLNGAQTWATHEKVGSSEIHTFYGIGMDGSQRDEKLVIDRDTMQFKSKGFLLPSSGICWIER